MNEEPQFVYLVRSEVTGMILGCFGSRDAAYSYKGGNKDLKVVPLKVDQQGIEKKEKPRFVYDSNLVEEPGEYGNVKLTPFGSTLLMENRLKISDTIYQLNPDTPLAEDTDAQHRIDGSKAEVVKVLEYLGCRDASKDREVIRIKFQSGPIKEVGVNGCRIEDVIDVLIERLEGFEKGPVPCKENRKAIQWLDEAKWQLVERTRIRDAQGVEGIMEAHES